MQMQKMGTGCETVNWTAFKERYGIESFIIEKPDRIEVIDSRIGVPTVRVMSPNGKWVFLHSSVDPMKEARKIAEGISIEPGKVIAVYGFALGYLVEALLEKLDERNPIFIIEPDRELFYIAMKTRDLRHLIESERIYLLVGDSIQVMHDRFMVIYDPVKHNELVMTGLQGHQTVYADFRHQVMKSMKAVVNIKLLNLVTLIKMGPDFVSNTLLNLAQYCAQPGIASLFERLAGKPVIIVAAGPSLNKNIQLLKKAKGKAAIFAVGTALKALNKCGIEPDLVFSIDPQLLNYEKHFKGVDMGGASLVAEIQSHHMILENFQGTVFVSGSMGILKWFGDSIESKGTTQSGGSVAHNAFTAAYQMGANPIILVGQDLAYARDGHSHASGTNYENNIYSGGENLDYFHVKANDGGQILTDRSFFQFLNFFQLWIEKYPEREYINATEGGAYIQGTKLMTLQEVLDQYCQEAFDIQEIIKEVQEAFTVPPMEPILKRLKRCLQDTNRAITEANTALKHLTQLEKACTNRQEKKMQQHLKAVDKIYKRLDKDQHIREVGEVAQWFVHREINGVFARTYEAGYSTNDDYSNAIADYSLYYKNIIDGSKAVRDLLQRCIEKFRSGVEDDK
ncbi:protein of unknown function DUF115 [Pelosinus fermentans A11]|uniref:Motility accessory factor n=3 Tax=Pelosinus TaxID=365348 RepID=I8RKW0_9FIRM|nr:6-hydroxymethylpterin diphosphokinase MptE-like protein [Pelosinus fermentans]EIW20918.1 protein of unknown function DUF115 [Pelosinus fermentans B4]EIW27215.1 protein of unknown function DUF115 [Pelosinus fermentans A11]